MIENYRKLMYYAIITVVLFVMYNNLLHMTVSWRTFW